MNLLFDDWIPVRCRSGTRDIAPTHLADPADPPLELVAPRPDFDAALAQFLIGLLQSLLPPRSEARWQQMLAQPPTPAQLAALLTPYRDAFELLPEQGAAFMQDHDRAELAQAELQPIESLLIESRSASIDLFFKSGRVRHVSPACAAMALLSLQINSPSGGRGHRTGLRGGGPLTTLIWPRQDAARSGAETTLWQKCLFNVLCTEQAADQQSAGWPWLAETRHSRTGAQVSSGPKSLYYFACPRRVLLQAEPADGRVCDLTGRATEVLVSGWRTLSYGPDYPSNVFRHPLSPYYRQKPDSTEWLPLHPRKGGFAYRDFQQVADIGNALYEPAEVVAQALNDPYRRNALAALGDFAPLWANGFEMDNMKAKSWHEARFPLFPDVDPERREVLCGTAIKWTAAAAIAREQLGRALRSAWSPQGEGNTSAAETQFWSNTEESFYAALQASVQHAPASEEGNSALRLLDDDWRRQLRTAVLQIFGQHAERGNRQLDGLERAAKARKTLLEQFHTLVSKALDLGSAAPKPTKREAA